MGLCRRPGIQLTARALKLYHDFDAPYVPQDARYSLPLLCAWWRAGLANLDFANTGKRAHRQTLTVGFCFCGTRGVSKETRLWSSSLFS
jgi:hypothetical protein